MLNIFNRCTIEFHKYCYCALGWMFPVFKDRFFSRTGVYQTNYKLTGWLSLSCIVLNMIMRIKIDKQDQPTP